MRDSCVPGVPATTSDDAFVPGNGSDDDCDGSIDEDIPPCDTKPRTFEPGAYSNVVIPGNCHIVRVRLWAGGGGGGDEDAIYRGSGGTGGPGGYASATVLVAPPLDLYVGTGAAGDCNTPGTNAGSSRYNGGAGGPTSGAFGQDGLVGGGGNGGAPTWGWNGGHGFFGGGGGGEGNTAWIGSGNGGGGGAASVLIVNGVLAAVAGGGGGGGGAVGLPGYGPGGAGGSGCGRAGQAASADGGGGGGGGVCQGGATQAGTGANPAFSSDIPSGRARGGRASCGSGGAGYAILTFGP